MKTCPTCNKEFKNLGAHLKKHAKETKVEEVKPTALENGENIPLTEEVINTPEPVEPVTNVNNCEYHLIMQFNNEKYECFTNNLDISIQSLSKEVLTEVFIIIKKGTAEFTKKLTLIQARLIFGDAQSREIFLNTYYSLYGPSKI